MVDIVSPQKRSEMMAGIKGKNTKPELVVRRLLHAEGFRFRLHRKDLPGRPDIVLPRFKTAIFVNGCFWHGHGNCALYRPPLTRTEFWSEKISGNRARDARKLTELTDLGWQAVVVWECAIKGKGKLPDGELVKLLASSISTEQEWSEIRGSVYLSKE
jgi:DNA mismatch endonuclease (patch repair protein)